VLTLNLDISKAQAPIVNPTLSTEQMQGAILASRDSLLARELMTRDASGQLVLNDQLNECVQLTFRPQTSVGLTVHHPGMEPHLVFYNVATTACVGNWTDALGLVNFDMLSNAAKTMPGRLIKHWLGDAQTGKSVSSASYTIPLAALPADGVNPNDAQALREMLVQSGLPAGEANDVIAALSTNSPRAVLTAATQRGDQTEVDMMVWFGNLSAPWVVTQDTAKTTSQLQRLSLSDLESRIGAFVTRLMP
jgi:hypothetical protein